MSWEPTPELPHGGNSPPLRTEQESAAQGRACMRQQTAQRLHQAARQRLAEMGTTSDDEFASCRTMLYERRQAGGQERGGNPG
jgi:hypothetical protein